MFSSNAYLPSICLLQSSVGSPWIESAIADPLLAQPSPSLPKLPSRYDQLRSLLRNVSQNQSQILQLVQGFVRHKQSFEGPIVRKTFEALLVGEAIQSISRLRSFLASHSYYTDAVYLDELYIFKKHNRLHLAMQLYHWRHVKVSRPHLASEMLVLISMHSNRLPSSRFAALSLFQQFLVLGQREVLGTAGFNALLSVWASGHIRSTSITDAKMLGIFNELAGGSHLRIGDAVSSSSPSATTCCVPDAQTFEILVRGLASNRLAQKFYLLALESDKSSSALHEAYIHRLFSRRCAKKAMLWYEKLKKERRSELDSRILSKILAHKAATGNFSGTHAVFEDAVELGITPTSDMYKLLIDMCATIGNQELAEQFLIDDLARHGIEMDRNIYSSLINLYCATNALDKAVTMHKEMKLRGFKELPTTLAPLMIAHLKKARQMDNRQMARIAQNYWKEMMSMKIKLTPTQIAHIIALSTDMAIVSKIIATIDQYVSDRDGLLQIMSSLSQMEETEAERMLQVFSELTKRSNFKIMPWMYDRMIELFAKKRMWSNAFQLASECVDVAQILDFNADGPSDALKWTHLKCSRASSSSYSPSSPASSSSQTLRSSTTDEQSQSNKPKQNQTFRMGHQQSNCFVKHVILPSSSNIGQGNEIVGRWMIPPERKKQCWNRSTLSSWSDQLVRWKVEFRDRGLL